MTISIITTIAILLLLAYIFDISASKTKIPSVILLLLLGFCVKIVTDNFNIAIPDLHTILPVLGTIGLILIVLEGSLELEINKSKLSLIFKSPYIALLPLLIISIGFAYYLNNVDQVPLKLALANTIPLAIISSAIAIPSAKYLLNYEKEFITYESSLSDIFGVIFFNFITLNDNIGTETIVTFFLDLMIMLLISFVLTLLLTWFLSKIKHHIKFVPIIIMVLLIYCVSKLFHLPGLIFILIFGLFIGNIDELRNYKLIKKFYYENFTHNVHKFKEITSELAFLIRALFFIVFGFLIDILDVLNSKTIMYALFLTFAIFLIRFIMLKMSRIPSSAIFFIAPRGLITILLFLSIPLSQQIKQIDKSLIIQVIILSALIMMIGMMRYKKPQLNNNSS